MQFTQTIDPKWGQWLNILAFVLSGLAMASWWQDFFTAKEVAAGIGIMNLVVSTINFVLHGMPTSVIQTTRVIIIALLFGALFYAGNAHAQGNKVGGGGSVSSAHIQKGPLSGTITSALNALANLVNEDEQGALTLSTQIPGLQDYVGQACWSKIALIGQVVKAHPVPVTLQVATDIEALRLVGMALNNICADPNCGSMWNDAQNVATAINPVPLPLSFTSICAKVPVLSTLKASALPASPSPVPASK